MLAHEGTLLHRFCAEVQWNPMPDQQSTDPHLQTPPPLLSDMPLSSAHTVAVWLHVLVDAWHTSPVVEVHTSEAPQTQGAALAVAPPPWRQTGPVKVHTHAAELSESQEIVEDVSVLKYGLWSPLP